MNSVLRSTIRLLSVSAIAFISSSCIRDNSGQADVIEVIAHRGYHLTLPENTLESFTSACNKGYASVEFDVCFTKDFAPVILHDLALDNQSDTTGLIGDMLLSDISNIRLTGGYRIPVLNETLNKIGDYFETIFIDLKTPCPDSGLLEFIRIIRGRNLYPKTVITSTDLEVVRKLKAWEPQLVLGTDGSENGFENNLDECIKKKYRVVLVPLIQLDKHLCFIAHANQVKIFAYTADTQTEAETALLYDIDGIMSDNPDLVRKMLQ